MAKEKVSTRTTAKRMKDKWRAKEWYRVVAPPMFNHAEIGETISDEPDKLRGRVVEVAMQDITGDFSKMHIKLQFKIDDVRGSDAHTRFVGHTLTSDYIRRMSRRKRSKMEGTFDVRTKDNFVIRVKPMAITEKRIKASQQQLVRQVMGEAISDVARKKNMGDFVKLLVSGDFSKGISKKCKPIYPIKRVEIRKSEILKFGEFSKETDEGTTVTRGAITPTEGDSPTSPSEQPPSEKPKKTKKAAAPKKEETTSTGGETEQPPSEPVEEPAAAEEASEE